MSRASLRPALRAHQHSVGNTAAGNPEEITVVAVDFNGTDTWLNRGSDLDGNADNKTFTFSCWVNVDSLATRMLYVDTSNEFLIQMRSAGELLFNATNAASSVILAETTATGLLTATTWHHILVSVDMANEAGSKLYIDDVDTSTTWGTFTDDTIDHTQADFNVGTEADTTGQFMAGGVAEYWFDNSYVDLSIIANRRKFISENGKPVNLTSAGTPLILFNQATATWQNNQGSGGGFTENGTLTTFASSPSD